MPPSTTESTRQTNGHATSLGNGAIRREIGEVDMNSQSESSAGTRFIWGVGVECSFLPHLQVDQFEWTQHDRFWKDDLRRIREELGVSHVRYALPWHQVETARGEFNWQMADERVQFANDIGLDLMMDVMHFGTPTWLPQAVGDPRFPESLEAWTTQLVTRYRNVIDIWCPFNEPSVSALFSGDFGFWPPFARKWRGYMPVLSRIVQAVGRSMSAIRNAHPAATVLLCDAVENFQTRIEKLRDEVAMRNQRRFLALDLLAGRVDRDHALYDWVSGFGMSELDLEYFRKNPQLPDWIGIDYYPHSDWQLDVGEKDTVRQRRADAPLGFAHLARQVYNRYGVPIMMTETSADGPPVAREIWLDTMVEQSRELRESGIPMLGMIWWPVLDQIDWDGALRHRVGKIHRVGMYSLTRNNGVLERKPTPLIKRYRKLAEQGDEAVGELAPIARPVDADDLPQLPALYPNPGDFFDAQRKKSGKVASPAATGAAVAPETVDAKDAPAIENTGDANLATGKYGIVVFSHLRWGFVWQRPQQFLSRFARHHPILFVEEPFFDLAPGSPSRLDLHGVMPNITVACPHCPPEAKDDPNLVKQLREWTREAIDAVNGRGDFDNPLLWYYSPMDSGWSLGHFRNRGVVYDCMDELSAFTGAPTQLIENEKRLIEHADVVFTGGMELRDKKAQLHPNVHFYGCGVEFDHFHQAADKSTAIPPDIDFLNRPIIGWFGVVDERVDYHLLAEIARLRPAWTFAIVGPVVKVDPNLLPHSPNLVWLGGRDYQQLPHYCAAFDVCMMCFAISKATEHINPTKALEYFATGKPVVTTPVKDVVRQYPDICRIATTPAEFVDAIAKSLHEPDPDRIERGMDLAKQKSWEGIVASMRKNIADAVGNDAPKRSTKATPLSDEQAARPYQSTPGS
jgi:beta-glucosidase/6-phospho-beta-glucosidase/beta-galactosidase/glycosyltransferase involved in cell wall biosynthesis